MLNSSSSPPRNLQKAFASNQTFHSDRSPSTDILPRSTNSSACSRPSAASHDPALSPHPLLRRHRHAQELHRPLWHRLKSLAPLCGPPLYSPWRLCPPPSAFVSSLKYSGSLTTSRLREHSLLHKGIRCTERTSSTSSLSAPSRQPCFRHDRKLRSSTLYAFW